MPASLLDKDQTTPLIGGVDMKANPDPHSLAGGDWKITGGGSEETFDFASVFNSAAITDFGSHATGAAHDTVSLSTADFNNWVTLLSDAAAAGTGGVNTTFTSTRTGDKLTLDGVTLAQLNNASLNLQADFTFHA